MLLRQDPPFDLSYISTHPLFLSACSRRRWWSTIQPMPATRRKKCSSTEFPDLMPPTLLTRDLDAIKAFRGEHGDIVMKPLYGNGGEAVFLPSSATISISARYTICSLTMSARALGGAEIPARREGRRQTPHPGRRRVRRRGQSRAGGRRPALQNGARRRAGGNRADRARTPHICERLGPALRQRGLLFVGIDAIGDHSVNEINVTSPTGIRPVKNLGGPDIAALIWDKIEAKLENRPLCHAPAPAFRCRRWMTCAPK